MQNIQSFIHSVIVDGIENDLKEDEELAKLEEKYTNYFGSKAVIWDLIEAFESVSNQLTLISLSITGKEADLVQTRAAFRHGRGQKQGTCVYYWRKHPDGSLERTRDAVLEIEGSRARLSLQIHSNMLTFARKLGNVRAFEVEARQVGRYAYRFLHGVEIDVNTRNQVAVKLKGYESVYGVPFDETTYQKLRSPREIADFVVLMKVPKAWMEIVDNIIRREGFAFTIDQVVDVARRPGLAFLLDMPSYFMRIDVNDDTSYYRFLTSVQLGREHRSLRRLRGLFGLPFQRLPRTVRSALIVYRPYVFPRPRGTPLIPDLVRLQLPSPPYCVTGFKCKDGVVLNPVPADPEGIPARAYRAAEIQKAVQAIMVGTQIISITGLSGSGKTELMIWQLETILAGKGHRVVSLDVLKLHRAEGLGKLLREIDDVVRPTVTIFDESLYVKGKEKQTFIDFSHRFLKWSGQHIIFIGGGLQSPEYQRREIVLELSELWERYTTAHVEVLPKPANRCQIYRFLGLGRLFWLDEGQRIDLLSYVLERYPPYFTPLVPIRFHETPSVRTLDGAKRLADENVVPDEWEKLTGMMFEVAAGTNRK